MRVGKTSYVDVYLASGGASLPPISAGGPSTSVLSVASSCLVNAELTGDVDAFTITLQRPDPQSFQGQRLLHWKWSVKPLRAGDGQLSLLLQSMTLFGQTPEIGQQFGPFTVAIAVSAEPGPGPGHAFWSWANTPIISGLIVAAIVGLAGILWRRSRHKSKSADPETETEPSPEKSPHS